EVSFWASLKTEEGRHHQFAVVYARPPETNAASNDYVVFNPRFAFDAEILAKLAPALQSTHTVRVWPKMAGAGKEELEIWGFAPLSEGPPLVVTAIEPGQIILTISDMWKAMITERAELVDVGKYDDIFSSVQPTRLTQKDATVEERIVEDHRRPDLERIAVAMRGHGHGGMLLVIPNDNTTWDASIDKGKFRFSPYGKFKKDLEKRDEAVRQFASGSTVRNFHSPFENMEQSINAIAQFTAVDGATIITPDRVLLGFGVKIKPRTERSSDENYKLAIANPFYKSELEFENLSDMPWGTRHKAAARFVYDQEGTVAIVASADGRLSVFKRDKRKIFVLTNAEFLWL